jgi:cytochrome c oxidase subunit 2
MLNYLPEGLSSFAADIDGLMWLIYAIVGAWFVAAELFLVWMVYTGWRRRRSGARAMWLPAGTPKTNAWVLVPVGAVLLCDFVIEAKADGVWHTVKLDIPEHPDVHVKITGRQYMWLFGYPGADGELGSDDDVVANELHVPVGKSVRFELEAADVLHSFFVPELRLKQDAVPGRRISGWFDTNRTGTFEVACAEICGRGHTNMRALLIVQEQADFDAWLAEQSGAAGAQ